MQVLLNKIATFNFNIQFCIFLCFFGAILHFLAFGVNQNKGLLNKNIKLLDGVFVAITSICFLGFLLSFICFDLVNQKQIIFGGFASKEISINYSSNIYKTLFCVLISLITLCYSIFITFVFNKQNNFSFLNDKIFSNAIVLCCLGSFLCIINTNDIFNMYVFIEVLSICLYTSSFLNRNIDSIKVGFKYLIAGSLASCMIIFCIIILYHISGHLNIDLITIMSYKTKTILTY